MLNLMFLMTFATRSSAGRTACWIPYPAPAPPGRPLPHRTGAATHAPGPICSCRLLTELQGQAIVHPCGHASMLLGKQVGRCQKTGAEKILAKYLVGRKTHSG